MNKLRLFLIGLYLLLSVPNIIGNNCFKLQQIASRTAEMSYYFLQSDSIALTDIGVISGFAISGEVRKTSPEYVIRVILTDIDGNEYLVMESYDEINSDSVFYVVDYCEETALLSGITPVNLKVFLKDASFQLTRMSFSSSLNRDVSKVEIDNARKNIKKSQTETIISKINAYNRSHNRLWVAGETPLSQLEYSYKKHKMGLNEYASSGGIEYYVEGVFEIRHNYGETRSTPSNCINRFDWRYMHGKNNMSSIKNQTGNTCSAFATNGCVEALANLYYNTDMELDLSEMELISCSDSVPHNYQEYHNLSRILSYVVNHGVCDEQTYPFETTLSPVCKNGIISPIECVSLSDYDYSIDIKRDLINYGPMVMTVNGGIFFNGHAMVLCGYNTIHVNDTLYRVYDVVSNDYITCVVEPNDPRKDMTYWILKNSWGNTYFNSQGGYMYLLDTNNVIGYCFKFNLPLIAQGHTDAEIVWEDRDGDGYFNWGIGSRPSSVPEWVPYIRDGDDSDNSKGTLDQYGYCADLAANIADTLLYDRDGSLRDHIEQSIKIARGATVVIESNISCLGYSSITIDENSTLIIDGYKLRNADIHMKPQSHLIVRNGGEIYLKRYESLDVPLGATVDISEGAIFNRPY